MPTPEQIQESIRNVTDPRSFIDRLLRETLGWPIHLDFESIEDITYEWTDDELNTVGLSRDILTGPVLQMQSLEQDREQPWGIFILEFANITPLVTGRGLTGPLRKVLRGLVPKRRDRQANLPAWNRENLLFICTHQYQHFRFAYFKTPKEKGHAEPLTTFGWEPGVPPRTVCEFNLGHLCWPEEPSDADKWVIDWSKAFDVEAVTKKFYDDYEQVFRDLQAHLDLTDAEDKKMFAQILMNRLMFLRFVERKGWLKFGDVQEGPQNYLKKLFEAGPVGSLSWYRSRLMPLFFEGMAVPGHQQDDAIGQVPYLNGGLFTRTQWDDMVDDITDEVFEPILGEEGLFYRYNFTIEESTPLDIDVAVDPEMLGKVFEKLVTTRRQRGSYYTPRTVVSFMCRETLKGYLGSYYAPLIDEGSVERIGIPEARDLLGRLASVKVVDPACGSGAYLLGMLQELFRITKLLDTRAETETPHDAYHRKLTIIQNNLYGVDIDEFTINIAHLRLWLSLAVEFEGDEPEPLPNLDLKIECGDSLTAPDPSGAGQMDLIRQQQITELERLKAIHMDPRLRAQCPGLENEIAQLKEQIAIYAHPDETVEGFDWRVEFAEVWSERGGFDIVLANPPYGVRVNDNLRNQYFNQRIDSEKGQSKDSYGIFLSRGLQLLRPNGTLSYIVSDTWRTIKSHKPLRKRLLEKTTVFHVLDLPPWIFDATVNTCVVTLKKMVPEEDHKLIAGDLRGLEKGDWKGLSDNLIAVSGHGPDIQILNCARYTYPQNHISAYDNLSFFIGAPELYSLMSDNRFQSLDTIADVKQGLATGDNQYYLRKREGAHGSYDILDEDLLLTEEQLVNLTSDEKLNGIDPTGYEGRYFIPHDKGGASDAEGGWLPNYHVPTQYFIDWSRATVERLKTATIADVKRRKGLEDEIKPRDHTRIASRFQNSTYYFREGLTYSQTGFYAPTFRLGNRSVFNVESTSVFPKELSHEALLGILCSLFYRYEIKQFIDHTVHASVEKVASTVLPCISQSAEAQIVRLVQRIIERQAANPRYAYYLHEQREIDALVNELYGLSEDDIREVELWYCRRYPKLAEAQGVLAKVKDKYSDHLACCQRILEKPPSYWRSNPILELIAQGESHTLEFKETLEYNIHTNERTPGLAKSSLKTIAAFLNANGGTLLIGVSDTGEVKGIARDLQFVRGNNCDGFEQKLRSLINDHFDPSPLGNVEIAFEELQEGTVCKIKVQQSSEPIAYDNDFYIRDGNSTRKLEGRDLADWLRRRNNS